MPTRHLVLFNGGLKSAFMADLARREGEAILCYFLLTERDRFRIKKVKQLATVFDLELIIQDMQAGSIVQETLLSLLHLVLNALPWAKRNYCNYIYHGLSRDDDFAIVTIMDAFIKQLNSLIELGQPLYDGKGFWLGHVSLETPLRCLDRRRVIRLGNEFNLPWELSFSCDVNASQHCGRCKSCLRRQHAFELEGHNDPTFYQE